MGKEKKRKVHGYDVEGESSTWRAATRENQVLRLDMDSMRTRVHQLEKECSMMREVIEKFEKEGPQLNCLAVSFPLTSSSSWTADV
ncbi:hypothetical protein SLE2022_311280 [Rubroshorea leprosula]